MGFFDTSEPFTKLSNNPNKHSDNGYPFYFVIKISSILALNTSKRLRMTELVIPKRYDIYKVPTETDTLPPFPIKVADGILKGLGADNAFRDLSYVTYTNAVVGSGFLEEFYQIVTAAMSKKVRSPDTYQPIGFVQNDGNVVVGRVLSDKVRQLTRVAIEPNISEISLAIVCDATKGSAGSYLRIAPHDVRFIRCSNIDDVKMKVEKTAWQPELDGMIRVERSPLVTHIAIGVAAVESLPLVANDSNASRALSLLMNP